MTSVILEAVSLKRSSTCIVISALFLLGGCSSPTDTSSIVPPETQTAQPPQDNFAELEAILSIRDLPLQTYPNSQDKKGIVVYLPLPSYENSFERKLKSLRAVNQVFREHTNVESITIWDDQESARQYASNEANSQNRIDWDGLNHRVAFAHVAKEGVSVFYANGRDDFEDISFGMARLE
ncbi:hypothetical protein [Brevibacillus sp. SYSU BS000544]|uniref:hypothetical protein n=1 Tax=Brevibacillus sp. SYSU BS000544 TaxID=3416443 RepID=UPI003CE4A2BF